MGMFDTIYCRQTLPDGWRTDESFQSKSLHNALCVYEISADGRLREIALNEQGNPVPDRTTDTAFHGVMHFYTYVDTHLKAYEAKFTDGALVDLRDASDAHYDEHGMRKKKADAS